MENKKNKPFRQHKTGKKIQKKQRKLGKKNTKSDLVPLNHGSKETKSLKRAADRAHRKEHRKLPCRTVDDFNPPPIVVAVIGPNKVGKSTLIRQLLKHYCKRNVGQTTGPLTVVTGRHKRVTFIECPVDICAIVDIAKIADLALLLVDAKVGFEMETFEFINIAKTHGFMKVMGVLTHMDLIQNQTTLRKCKSALKKRLVREVYPGVKLFFLSAFKNGKYLKNEIKNLARFISQAKLRPIEWRNNHPYILVDRFEDLTPKNDNRNQREISFYGYVRGTTLRKSQNLHFVGVCDLEISSIKLIEDPCPLPDTTKRRISELQRKVYAPLADLGDIICDEDAVYIDIKEHKLRFTPKTPKNPPENQLTTSTQLDEGTELVKTLQNVDRSKIINPGDFKIFSKQKAVSPRILHEINRSKNIHEENKKPEETPPTKNNFDHSLTAAINNIRSQKKSLHEEIYGNNQTKTPLIDCEREETPFDKEEIRKRFVTFTENGSTNEEIDTNETNETTETKATYDVNTEMKKMKKKKFDLLYDSNNGRVDEMSEENDEMKNQNSVHDDTKEYEGLKDSEKAIFRGFVPGSYVRIVLENVPREFVERFDRRFPIILGGSLIKENSLNFIQADIQKHRWHKSLIKSKDPLIFSAGWKRFQSMPIFSISDPNGRNRHLKYTPENSHCLATFWGPQLPQGSGFCCFQKLESERNQFQVVATGIVKECANSFKIVKKLKLVGEPYKIERNTAFIKGMFNSPLEAAKFEGAGIRTVSGIRGAIKKTITNSDPGVFRATFEDKILYSDLVFLRCWVPVPLERFYNPLTTHLDRTPSKKTEESRPNETSTPLLRSSREVRKEEGVVVPFKADSVYHTIEREEKEFAPLTVPLKLQKQLPFKSKPKNKVKSNSFTKRRPKIFSSGENQIKKLVSSLGAIKNASIAKEKIKLKERQEKIRKQELREEQLKSY